MKLYQNTTRQIARKKIGKYWWPKLSYAAKLKPGDLISTCKGYNERIKEDGDAQYQTIEDKE